MKKWVWICCFLFACINVHAQSAWKKFPEVAEVACKKLRNTFTTGLYNDELQIEQANVVNNRMLRLQLRCASHSLEYRSEVGVAQRHMETGLHEEIVIFKPEEPLYFLPDETVEIGIDLSPFNQNGEYCFIIRLHTELKETFYIRVYLNTEEFPEPRGFETMPTYGFDYEKEQEDEDYIYSFIKDFPEFPGGTDEMKRYIRKNVRNKELWKSFDKYQRLGIGVVIDKDGSILYPEIVDGHLGELNEDIMRIIRMMPKWKPGRLNGKNVKCRVYISIVPIMIDKLLP